MPVKKTSLQPYDWSKAGQTTVTSFNPDGSVKNRTLYNSTYATVNFRFQDGMATTVDHVTPTKFSWQKSIGQTTQGRHVVYFGGKLDAISEGSRSPFGGGPTITLGWKPINTVYNKALSRLHDNFMNSDLNLATSLAEGRESIDMVKGVATSVARLVKMARSARRDPIAFAKQWGATKRQLRAIRRNPSNAVTSAWLSAKLGWMPLYSDIYNLALHRANQLANAVCFKSSARVVLKDEYDNVPWNVGNFRHKGVILNTEMQHVRFITWWTLSSQELLELRRLTSLNPLSVAWELTPLSFVVDWFVDIGGYLKLMEDATVNGLTFRYGCKVVYKERTERGVTREQPVSDIYGQGYTANAFLWYNLVNKSYSREVLTSSPLPMPPRLEPSVGMQRVMTGFSLIRQLLLPRKL